MPETRRRSAVEPGEQNVVEAPQLTDNLEQFYDEDGVLHDPLAGQGRRAFSMRPTSNVRGPDPSFSDTTGITPEMGVPQPGPALDALHAAGAVDDEAFEKRKQEIEQPIVAFQEQQAARDEVLRRRTHEAEARTLGHEPTGKVRTEAGEAGTPRANRGPDAEEK